MRIEYQPGSFVETDFDQLLPKLEVCANFLDPTWHGGEIPPAAHKLHGQIHAWVHMRYDHLIGQAMMKKREEVTNANKQE